MTFDTSSSQLSQRPDRGCADLPGLLLEQGDRGRAMVLEAAKASPRGLRRNTEGLVGELAARDRGCVFRGGFPVKLGWQSPADAKDLSSLVVRRRGHVHASGDGLLERLPPSSRSRRRSASPSARAGDMPWTRSLRALHRAGYSTSASSPHLTASESSPFALPLSISIPASWPCTPLHPEAMLRAASPSGRLGLDVRQGAIDAVRTGSPGPIGGADAVEAANEGSTQAVRRETTSLPLLQFSLTPAPKTMGRRAILSQLQALIRRRSTSRPEGVRGARRA